MKKISSSNKPKITDLKTVTKRAAIALPTVLGLFLASTVSATYVGHKTGELQEKIITPITENLSNFGQAIEEVFTYEPSPPPAPKIKTTTKTQTKTNTQVQTQPKTQTQPKLPTQNQYQYSTPSFSQEEWNQKVEQMKKDADARYQDSLGKQQEWSDQKTLEAAQSQADWAAEKQAEQEAWRQEHGF